MRRAGTCGFAWVVAVTLTVVAAGCGGGLKYTVDDAAMEPIPMSDRQAVFDARKEAELAEDERRNAEKQLATHQHDTEVAKKERDEAQLEIEKAIAEQEGAKASRNENQTNQAAHNKDLADLGLKVSNAKLDWLSEKKDWLKQVRVAAEAHVEAAKARVEYEKAKVAQQKGIKPGEKFDPADFESQWKSKQSAWQSEKNDADSGAKDVKDKEAEWKQLQQQHQKLRGG
jgi:hypothetical protein